MSDLKDKGLKLEDGKLLGLDDYVKTYKESDPHAFADDDGGNPQPRVVGRTTGEMLGVQWLPCVQRWGFQITQRSKQ